jgi:hypothetical protein
MTRFLYASGIRILHLLRRYVVASGTEWRSTRDLAPIKKSIHSLIDPREILLGCSLQSVGAWSVPPTREAATHRHFLPLRCGRSHLVNSLFGLHNPGAMR